MNDDRLDLILSRVRDEELTHPQDRRVFKAIREARAETRRGPVDLQMLKERLGDHRDVAYVADTISSGLNWCPNINLEAKFSTIAAIALRRDLLTLSEELARELVADASDDRVRVLAGAVSQRVKQARITPIRIGAVAARCPAFSVDHLVQRGALHLWWGASNAGKTYLLLTLAATLLARKERPTFLGHPDLIIRQRYKRVLLVTAEEDSARVRYRWDRVLRGLGEDTEGGHDLLHIWSAQPGARVYLPDLPTLVEEFGPDCVIADPLTALLPREGSEKWDLDNIAADDAAMALRGLCGELGVDVHLVHHANAAGERERGASAWGNSADVKVKLKADSGRIRVTIEKQRDAPKLSPFLICMEFSDDAVRFEYVGDTQGQELRPIDKQVVAFLRGAGPTPAYEVYSRIAGHKQTIHKSLSRLEALGLVECSGETVKQSPVWVAVPGVEGSETRSSPLNAANAQ